MTQADEAQELLSCQSCGAWSGGEIFCTACEQARESRHWALLDEQDAQRSAERAASSNQDITAECATVDCRSCGAALIGDHYHIYGAIVEHDKSQLGRDYIGCLCMTCYRDILDMIQSYVGA